MDKADKKLIIILLIIIIIGSIILSIEILSSRKYDEQLYNEIYDEYNEIFGDSNINENIQENKTNSDSKKTNNIYMQKTSDGRTYRVIASIVIPKIKIYYPVIAETSDEYLKIAPCKYWGGEPNEVGNLSIIGHNYKNTEFFSNINTLENGDKVILNSKTGSSLTYTVFDKYDVANNDFSCTNPTTDGTIDLTLITCTNKNSRMYVIKCRANNN